MAECLEHEGLTHKMPDVVFVRPRQARMLHRGPAKIVLLTLREMDRIIVQLSQCQSKTEFSELRKKLFSDYVNLSYILANSFSIPNDRAIRQAAIQQSFKFVERLLESKGVARVGSEVIKEAVFNVDTLRRAYRLVDLIHSRGAVPEASSDSDRKLAAHFNSAALWSQFNLDCLRYVITHRIGLDQEILNEIVQGLRLSTLAYSYARQGVELRMKQEPFLSDAVQDDEDRELLDESFAEHESNLNAES